MSLYALLFLASVSPVANQTDPVSLPGVGSENDVSVGDDMLKQSTMTTVKGANITAPFKVATYSFTSGFYPETGEDEKHIRLRAPETALHKGYGIVLPKPVFGINMAAGGVDFKVSKADRKVCIGGNCTIAPFTFESRQEVSENAFQQTLVYNGGSGTTIKIGYREFKDDLARPSFSNEIEYDISKSRVISYKRAKLEIIEADNTHIRYRVIANFN